MYRGKRIGQNLGRDQIIVRLKSRRATAAMPRGVLLVALCLLFGFGGRQSGEAYAQSQNPCRFSAIYNFGDSNSDTGCVSAALHRFRPPNGQTFFGKDSGRVCDGRLIIDFIAENLGLPYLVAYLDSIRADFMHGANFASSGSTIENLMVVPPYGNVNPFNLHIQLSQFEQFRNRTVESYSEGKSHLSKVPLPKPESFSRALFTMDTGQNDLDGELHSKTEDQVKASIPRIIHQFSIAVKELYNLGARAFWIHNTGPIGCLPRLFVENPPQPNNSDHNGCIKSYNEVAQEFNKQLKEKISTLRSLLPEAMLVYVDIYSVKYSLISQGKSQGFTDPLAYCCGKVGVVSCGGRTMVNGTEVYGDACSNPQGYISWDGTHYTEAANKWIATRIMDGDFSEPKVPIAEACHHSSSFVI